MFGVVGQDSAVGFELTSDWAKDNPTALLIALDVVEVIGANSHIRVVSHSQGA